MVDNLINQEDDRTKLIDGVFRIEVGPDTFQFVFIQDADFNIDDANLERDRIDNGKSVFTRLGDVIGTFGFRTKNTVDLYDIVTPATNTVTVSFWMEKLRDADPAVLTFIQKFKAPESAGSKFANIKYSGRIMKVAPDRVAGRAVDEFVVAGEVTGLTSALRQAT